MAACGVHSVSSPSQMYLISSFLDVRKCVCSPCRTVVKDVMRFSLFVELESHTERSMGRMRSAAVSLDDLCSSIFIFSVVQLAPQTIISLISKNLRVVQTIRETVLIHTGFAPRRLRRRLSAEHVGNFESWSSLHAERRRETVRFITHRTFQDLGFFF
jgi:hypothetical protein